MNSSETSIEMATFSKTHRDFKLNGMAFSADGLKEVAYSLIKEGEPFEKPIGDFLLDWLNDRPTLQAHTSGSTGKPKPIILQKRQMVNSALTTGKFFGLQAGDSALLCLPADYIAGKMMLVRAMVLGLELDYIEPSSSPLNGFSDAVDHNREYDFCAMVPLQVENAMDGLDTIKTLIIGGAPLSDDLRTRLQSEVHQTEIYETYGMTETITHVAVKEVSPATQDSFVALPNVTFSADERGCLIIDAPKLTDKPVVTNDTVDLLSKTEFVWLGRYDNVINSGGIKLFPERIESRLQSVIESRFFVAGVPDEKLGQKLILLVEGEMDKAKVLKKIESLSGMKRFEIPKEIHELPEFRMTGTGKIQRRETLNLLSKK